MAGAILSSLPLGTLHSSSRMAKMLQTYVGDTQSHHHPAASSSAKLHLALPHMASIAAELSTYAIVRLLGAEMPSLQQSVVRHVVQCDGGRGDSPSEQSFFAVESVLIIPADTSASPMLQLRGRRSSRTAGGSSHSPS